MPKLEFFFDISSPWTYLAFSRIEQVAAAGGAELVFRPFLVGGVFNAVNDSVYAWREKPNPVKLRYYHKDLQDWAREAGIAIGQPPVFPVNSVKAMRGCFVAEAAGVLVPYARALFEAYWGRLEDISQDAAIAPVLDRVGLDREDFFRAIAQPDLKDRLRANTAELIERGGFGSPTMFVDGTDMYFGNDRLPLVLSALALAG
ncbi:2-hydroxychromene-2-carboxylate isomerase [Zavarzinia compransoris]|uniref:2-hydroxychromene-2-carboxylate isomerase n=1 Tax=Zavarzinia compransoris TaxID=1264899 RepID=A0A317DYF3_9PROT|nr:2-hydroxychromene-2-carboxylate isomerase [Zavarzinia compransoris]PWR18023.1 2-hydroxychromene-2-carboxylate isomerase [Zavarzinia compransoris]TDP43511.1 2-hydroxychromene-2-carboxylate isomerase [Zavarzinia compransoris]